MATTFTSEPGSLVYPAGQRLMYAMTTTETIVSDFRYVITVMENNSVEIGKFYLTPNVNDVAFFDLSQVLEGRFSPDLVDNTGGEIWEGTTILTKSLYSNRGYQVRLAYFTAGVESATTDTSDIHLINGYLQQRLGLNPGFTDYYPSSSSRKGWLVDKEDGPSNIDYKMRAEDSATFAFIFNDIVSTALNIKFQIFKASGLHATHVYDISIANGAHSPLTSAMGNGKLICYVNAGPVNLANHAVNPLVSDWTKYVITIAAGPAYYFARCKTLTITRDCSSPKTEPTQMTFSNSVSGYDYIRWDGRRKQTLNKQDKSYRKVQGTWGSSTFTVEPTGSDTEVFQKEVTENYVLNGLMSAADFTLLSSAFKSRHVFLKIDGYWLPCKIKEGSMTLQNEPMSKLTSVTVTAEITQAVRC